jgi:hypothetical protein
MHSHYLGRPLTRVTYLGPPGHSCALLLFTSKQLQQLPVDSLRWQAWQLWPSPMKTCTVNKYSYTRFLWAWYPKAPVFHWCTLSLSVTLSLNHCPPPTEKQMTMCLLVFPVIQKCRTNTHTHTHTLMHTHKLKLGGGDSREEKEIQPSQTARATSDLSMVALCGR